MHGPAACSKLCRKGFIYELVRVCCKGLCTQRAKTTLLWLSECVDMGYLGEGGGGPQVIVAICGHVWLLYLHYIRLLVAIHDCISLILHVDWILIIVASVLCTVFGAVLILLIAKCLLLRKASSKLSKQPSVISHLKDSSIHTLEVVVHSGECTSSQESGKLLGSSGQESHVSTPTSVESTTPLFKDPSGSSQGT